MRGRSPEPGTSRRLSASVVVAASVVIAGLVGSPVASAAATAASPSATPSASPSASSSSPAAVPLTFGLKPKDFGGQGRKNFSFLIAPGRTTNDAVSIYNFSKVPLKLTLYVTDAYTNPEGNIVPLLASQKATDVGTWIRLLIAKDSVLIVPARSRVDVPFLVNVPKGARPGDHAGAVVVSLRSRGEVTQDSGGAALAVDSRVSSSLNVRVAGDVVSRLDLLSASADYRGTWNPFAPGSADVTVQVKNAGNVAQGGGLDVDVAGLFGTAAPRVHVEVPPMTPGAVISLTVPVPGVWPTFTATATATLTPRAQAGDPVGPTATQTVDFRAWPWPQIILGLAVILLVVSLVMIARRRRRGSVPPSGGRHGSPATVLSPQSAGVS